MRECGVRHRLESRPALSPFANEAARFEEMPDTFGAAARLEEMPDTFGTGLE